MRRVRISRRENFHRLTSQTRSGHALMFASLYNMAGICFLPQARARPDALVVEVNCAARGEGVAAMRRFVLKSSNCWVLYHTIVGKEVYELWYGTTRDKICPWCPEPI
eukprot:scaffold1806_cov156-Amphora_coffeaeformis.AAC.3